VEFTLAGAQDSNGQTVTFVAVPFSTPPVADAR